MPVASPGGTTFIVPPPAALDSPTSKKLKISVLLAAAGTTRTRLNSVVAESLLAKMRMRSNAATDTD